MTLRTAFTCMLVAFIVGAFAGYRYAVDQAPGSPATAMAASVPVPASGVAPATSIVPSAAPAPALSATAVVRPVATATPTDAAPTPPARSYPPGPDATKLSHTEYVSEIERFFVEEGEDPAWRAATESMLTNHFYRENPLGVGSTLDSVECRASICKLRATTMDQDVQNLMGPRIMRWGDMTALFTLGNQAVTGGPSTFTIYLRPQAAFPAAPHP